MCNILCYGCMSCSYCGIDNRKVVQTNECAAFVPFVNYEEQEQPEQYEIREVKHNGVN